jgi:hypothetical protein
MGKITVVGLLPPDHPIYSGGVEMFSPRVSRRSSRNSASDTAGEAQARSASAESGMPESMKRELDEALTERMRQGLKEQFSPSAPTGEFRSPTGDESEDSKN